MANSPFLLLCDLRSHDGFVFGNIYRRTAFIVSHLASIYLIKE